MNDYKLTATLKQYTPLLHFQGRQEGACLRGSEVKPKLDRYVVQHLRKRGAQIPDTWIQRKDGDRIALLYKLRFEGVPEQIAVNHPPRTVPNEIHRLYFGAMGDDAFEFFGGAEVQESKVKAVTYAPGSLRCELLCLAGGTVSLDGEALSLTGLLRRLLPPFFALHCFGTRSSKGFGSFAVEVIDGKPVPAFTPEALIPYLPADVRMLCYLDYRPGERPRYLDDVYSLSALMKGGLNFDGVYIKGAVFKYIEGYSEKALIKRDLLIFPKDDLRAEKKYGLKLPERDSAVVFKRGVLGLTEYYEYRANQRDGVERRGTVSVADTNAAQAKKNGKESIERFEHPIRFRPCGSYLLMLPYPIPQKLLGAEFVMSAAGKAARIRTPEQFDPDAFMEFFAEFYRTDRDVVDLRRKAPCKSVAGLVQSTVQHHRTFHILRKEETE